MPAFTRRQYAGAAAATTITAGINTTDTTCTLAATTGWPSTGGVPFYVVIDPGTSAEEKCSATISGSTLTLTRAQDDTTASSHSSGAAIYPVFTANDADEANELVAKLTTKGDLLVTTGSALNRLAVGTNGHQLTADSASTNGVKWALSPETDLVTTKGDILVGTAADTLARQGVGANGSILMADSAQTNGIAWSTAQTSNRNAVINGSMSVWQRGTSFALAAFGAYTADRWRFNSSENSGRTISRQLTGDTTNLPNIQYCARIQRNSGNTVGGLEIFNHSLETANSFQFVGKQVTLSFYARRGANYSATSNLLSVQVSQGTGTDQEISAGYTGSSDVLSSTATLTTTWQRFTYTGTVATTTTEIGLKVFATTTGTAGANDYYEITGVQLEAGSVATPFESEHISTTLAKCQRYYFRQGGDDVFQYFGSGAGVSATDSRFIIIPPVQMRTAPSSVEFSTIATYEIAGGSIIAVTTCTLAQISKYITAVAVGVASGLVTARPLFLIANNSSSGYIALNAEL